MNRIRAFRSTFLDQWFSLDTKAYFVIICALYFSSLMLKRVFIVDDIAAFEILSERGEMWVFDLFFGLQYFIVPVFLIWKFTLTAFLLWIGCFLFGYKVYFNRLWKLVLIMELTFIVPEFLKILWLIFDASDSSYQDVVAFYPLSLINLFNHNTLASAFHYPLKGLNIFEVLYWFLLSFGVYWLSDKQLKVSFYIIISSYVFPFLCWLLFYTVVYR
ncbi:MAG: hypothetical protein ACJA0X_001218 [Cyclobacteriaceae bacterium]|jgi:hypothetical protein